MASDDQSLFCIVDSNWTSRAKKQAFKTKISTLMSKVQVSEERIGTLESEVQVLTKKLAFLQKFDLDRLSNTDVTFIVDNQKVAKAHRFILACKSSVFKQMFDTDMTERHSGEIHIQDIRGPILRSLVKFLYIAEVKFTEEVSPAELLMAAHKYDVPELQAKCEVALCDLVSKENCSELLEFAHFYSLSCLVETCEGICKLLQFKLPAGNLCRI